MTINDQIRLYRVFTAVSLVIALLGLTLALEQVIVHGIGGSDVDQPLTPDRLRSSLEAHNERYAGLEQQLREAEERLREAQELYQEEMLINNALREDLKKATARLRRVNEQ